MTVFKTMKEEEINILTPLLLITNSWLQGLILYKPLDSSWWGSGGTILEAWAYCVPVLTGWELKPLFYFLQTLHSLFGFWLSEKAKILASNIFTCTVLFFLLVSTLFASHFSVVVEILLGKAKGTGPLAMTTGPVLGSGALTTTIWPQSLAGNPSPALSHCGPGSLVVMTTCAGFFFFFLQNFHITWLFCLPLRSSSLRSTSGLLEMLSTRLEVLKIPTE